MTLKSFLIEDNCPVRLCEKLDAWCAANGKPIELHFSMAAHHSGSIDYAILILYRD